MFRRVLIGVGALLVGFHLWLLASQVWGGQLADVALATRWLVAGGLLFGLRSLKRRDLPMFWGRPAVALWLLAALLHGPALADRLGFDGAPAASGIVATVAQSSVGAAVVAGLLILLALASGAKRRVVRLPARGPVLEPVLAGAFSPDAHSFFAPRPPPVLQM